MSTGSGGKCVSYSSSRCCRYDISRSKVTSGYPNRGEPQAMQVELVWPSQRELLSSHDFASCEADGAKQDCVSVGSHQTTKSRFFKRWGNKHKKHLVACTFEPQVADDDDDTHRENCSETLARSFLLLSLTHLSQACRSKPRFATESSNSDFAVGVDARGLRRHLVEMSHTFVQPARSSSPPLAVVVVVSECQLCSNTTTPPAKWRTNHVSGTKQQVNSGLRLRFHV